MKTTQRKRRGSIDLTLFAPYPKEGDESYHFMTLVFNVETAKELVRGREPNAKASVDQVAHGFVRIDEARAMSDAIDPTIPAIVITFPGDYGHLPIDGAHRAFKARALGWTDVPAHLLTVEESRSVCCSPSSWTLLEDARV